MIQDSKRMRPGLITMSKEIDEMRQVTAIIEIENDDGTVEFMKMRVDNWEMRRDLQRVYSARTCRVVDFIPGPEYLTVSGQLYPSKR
jgi:hypothetical protein